MLQFLLFLGVVLLLAWPLGHYMAAVMRGAPMRSDALFAWIERPVYALLGVDARAGMGWRRYALAFGASNGVLLLAVGALFMAQGWLPLNPNAAPNMRWDLALHTVVSFLTNTDQQHYSGQAQLSHLSQMVGIVALQFVSPAMGLALVVATLRALFGGRARTAAGPEAGVATETNGAGQPAEADVGNYWVDVVRATLRILVPLALAWTVLLTACRPRWRAAPRCNCSTRRRRSAPRPRPRSRFRWGRSRRWWPSNNWAATVAAGMAPTVPWRWRTRRRCPTFWSCWP